MTSLQKFKLLLNLNYVPIWKGYRVVDFFEYYSEEDSLWYKRKAGDKRISLIKNIFMEYVVHSFECTTFRVWYSV